MATTDRLLYISSDGLVRQLGFDPTAADLGGAAGVASSTHAATSKTTPVDADELPIVDSAASWGIKKLTWANLKATLKTYFDTLYLGISATAANASQLLGFTWASPGTIGSTTPNSGAFTTLTSTGVTSHTVNSASAALTVTQTGSGNAFVVEDAASDATPFVIDASGNVVAGHTSTALAGPLFQTVSTIAAGLGAVNASADSNGPVHTFAKARGTVGAPTVVLSGDTFSRLDFSGHDGTGYIVGARITAAVDGTPGTNDMPGRLVFSTTADGASTPTERMRIDSSGNVGLGISPSSRLDIGSTSATVVDFKLRNSLNTAVTYVNSDGSVVINGINAYPMLFATSGVERMRIDSSGNVGIGAAPTYDLDISKTKTGTALVSRVYNAGTGAGSEASLRVTQGVVSGTISAQGDSALYIGASSNHPVVLLQNSAEVLRISTAKEVLVTNPAGLGYGTGAGGTVTQATSKSTTVTLNKPSGQITMNNAALGAGSSVAFQMNNSVFGINDTCIGSINTSLAGYSSYEVKCFTFAGGVVFSIKNISGGSLSDAVVVDFRLLKGATS